MTLDLAAFQAWIGRQEIVEETLRPEPSAALSALLDRDDAPGPGDPLPALWHWIHCLPMHRQSDIAEDGHTRRGGFVPPIALPQRMFAGARLRFPKALRIGERARRTATITGIDAKAGRTGDLVLLRIRNEVAGADGPAIIEEQDIVYRDRPGQGAPMPAARRAPDRPAWRREIQADVTMLFRYSALLFSAHRIHYDRPYAAREGYPGLVVHGQLVATLLADLVRRHAAGRITTFRFRSIRPLLDTAPFAVCSAPAGSRIALWAEDADGALAMEAEAEIEGA